MLWFSLSDCTDLAMIGTLTFGVNAYENLMSEPLENKRALVAGNNQYLFQNKTSWDFTRKWKDYVFLSPVLARGLAFVLGLNSALLGEFQS